MLPILNQAIQHMVRELEIAGVPTTKRDSVITLNGAVTPITPPNQPAGTPDPSIQVIVGFNGYFNGSVWSQWPQLPADMITVRRVYARPTGTNLTFSEIGEVPTLESMFQDQTLGNWCFRQDELYFNGSIVSQDLRIEYISAGFAQFYSNTTPPSSFPTTYITFLDSMEPLSYYCAAIFADSRNAPGSQKDLWQKAAVAMAQTKNRYVRRQQRVGNYSRQAYGSDGDIFGWFG